MPDHAPGDCPLVVLVAANVAAGPNRRSEYRGGGVMKECAIGLLVFGTPRDPDGTPPAYTIPYSTVLSNVGGRYPGNVSERRDPDRAD